IGAAAKFVCVAIDLPAILHLLVPGLGDLDCDGMPQVIVYVFQYVLSPMFGARAQETCADTCMKNFITSSSPPVTFELHNGDCNMRRTRMLGPEKSGVEQSITIIISFHSTFITKVDRAYRYMFSMLVHSCFVDDSNGQERMPFIDEHGCAIDPIIVPDLVYNKENNVAFAAVNVFKFADKITTYFQCAISTCMIAEGTCNGRTPPRCGPGSQRPRLVRSIAEVRNTTRSRWIRLDNTMDVSAQKITVLDLQETPSGTPCTQNRVSLKCPKRAKGAAPNVVKKWYGSSAWGQALDYR
ncbi:zona pellucida-like domain protein, partial [Teladorsagia circumcincta]